MTWECDEPTTDPKCPECLMRGCQQFTCVGCSHKDTACSSESGWDLDEMFCHACAKANAIEEAMGKESV